MATSFQKSWSHHCLPVISGGQTTLQYVQYVTLFETSHTDTLVGL